MTSGNVAHLMFLFLFLANSMKGKTFVESREQKGGWGVEGGHLKWPHHVNYDLKLSKSSSYTNRWRGGKPSYSTSNLCMQC